MNGRKKNVVNFENSSDSSSSSIVFLNFVKETEFSSYLFLQFQYAAIIKSSSSF